MAKKINRRSFMKKGAVAGATSVIGSSFLGKFPNRIFANDKIDISVAHGKDHFDSTVKAMQQLGGMKTFVHKDSKVALLPNAQRNNPGTFTKPAIVRAVIKMCFDAGAKEVNVLSWLDKNNWETTGLAKAIQEVGGNLVLVPMKKRSLYKSVKIEKGKALKEAEIVKAFYENDVFIDMPITKDHAGNKFTGTMKNLMGLNYCENNWGFHKKGWKTDIDSIIHLDQCIADLNTIIKPDLCVVDATEFITTNGPMGPGELIKPQKVVAGTDRVAMDAYCCTLWGLKADEIIMINKAYEHGLGEINLKKVNIKEIEVG